MNRIRFFLNDEINKRHKLRIPFLLPILILLPFFHTLDAQIIPTSTYNNVLVLYLINEGRIEEAELFRNAVAFLPLGLADIDLALGSAFFNLQDHVKSLKYLERAWPQHRSQSLAQSIAYAAFITESWDKAESYAQLLLDSFGEYEISCELLGSLALIRDEPTKALFYWNKIGKPVLFSLNIFPDELRTAIFRSFPIKKGKIIRVHDWLETEDFLNRLGFLQKHNLILIPRENGLYDLQVHLAQRPPFYKQPHGFLFSEAINILQNQVKIDWNLSGNSRTSIGFLYRWQRDREAMSFHWSKALAFHKDCDFRLTYIARDEILNSENISSTTFQQKLFSAEATGRLFGSENDRLGIFIKSYNESGKRVKKYFGSIFKKTMRLIANPRSSLSVNLCAEVIGEVSSSRRFGIQTNGSLSLALSTHVDHALGKLRGSLFYARSWLPDLSDYWILGVGPGIRHLLRAHPRPLNSINMGGGYLYSKHFLLSNSQLEIDLSTQRLVDLKLFSFWDCYLELDRDPHLFFGPVNDIGFGLEFIFFAKGAASLCLGYNIEKRSLSVYIGPSWSWD